MAQKCLSAGQYYRASAEASRPKIRETLLYAAKDFGYSPICYCDWNFQVPRLYGKISIREKEGEPKKLVGQLGIRIRTNDTHSDSQLEREADAQGLTCRFRGGCPVDRYYVVDTKIDIQADDPQRESKLEQIVGKLNTFAVKVHTTKEQGLPLGYRNAPQIELVEAISARPLVEPRAP